MQKITISDLLYMSGQKYNEFLFDNYFNWCSKRSRNYNTDLQKMVANSKMFNWYQVEFKKREMLFIDHITAYHSNVSFQDARRLYKEVVTDKMECLFPMPLLEAARTLTIINPISI